MQITFNTSEVSPKEAAGLAALLVTLHGSAVLAALEDVDFGCTPEPANNAILPEASRGFPAAGPSSLEPADPRAADGHPTETNAAEAFGEAPVHLPLGAEVDSAGTPWDERIHSGSRGTNKDGTWTRRRNTPDETFDTVMAELKGRGGAPVDPTPPTESASTDAPSVPAPTSDAASGSTPPPPPPPAAPPAPPASAAPITFPTLMVKITKAQGAGQIDKATVDGFIKELGATSMAQLASQPEKLAEINKLVDATLGA